MKKRYLIGGFSKVKYEDLIKLMNSIPIINKVNDRYASDVQKEINYRDEVLDIYIYDDLQDGFVSSYPTFMFDIELKGTLDEAQSFINNLTERLRGLNSPHQFEWNEIDEGDNQIGEEFEIKFPES